MHPHSIFQSRPSSVNGLEEALSAYDIYGQVGQEVFICSASYLKDGWRQSSSTQGRTESQFIKACADFSATLRQINPLDGLLRSLLLPSPELVDAPRIHTADLALEKEQWKRHGKVDEAFVEGAPVDCISIQPAGNGSGTRRVVKSLLTNVQAQERCGSNVAQCKLHVLEPGQALYPGFYDAHGHILELGWSLSVTNLVGCDSVSCIISRLEAFLQDKNTSEDSWIEGLGWDQTRWTSSEFPTAKDLEESPVLRGRKVVLRRVDVHALWVSQAVIDLLEKQGKIPSPDTDIPGGLILRDAHARPTGVFVDKAMDIVYSTMPEWTDKERTSFLATASARLLSSGITSVGDAAVDPPSIDFFKAQDEQGKLPLRIYTMMDCSAAQAEKTGCLDRVPFVPEKSGGRLTARAIKLFADGALGSWGSAMWDPYEDKPHESGLLLMPEEEIEPTIRGWMDKGFQVAVHCIGDRANTLALDAYEKILSQNTTTNEPRPRIEHSQILRLSDIPRFAELGVIPSMQPTHCTSDMGYVETRLGSSRAKGAYPWRSLVQSGSKLALGSDFPVELPDVTHGFYSAISRKWPDGSSPTGKNTGWFANETLSRGQALRGFTADAAYAQFEEEVGGRLMPGLRADMVLLDRDIMDPAVVPETETRKAKVLATCLDGHVAFKAS